MGTRFPSRSVSSAPAAPLLEPIPLSTSASLVCPPQAQSRFLGREGMALHGVPSPAQPRGAAACLSVFLSSPACRQQLARQGQPPDAHHVQVPARLQQQQQLGSLAPLHQRQGKAVPTAAVLRPSPARGEPSLEGMPPRSWLGESLGWALGALQGPRPSVGDCCVSAPQLSRVNSLKEPNSICESSRKPSYRSEPSLEPESFRSPTFGKSFHFDPLSSGSRSSSLKSAQGTGFEMGHLQSIRSEGTTSTSYKSLVNQTRNGSLSYDSLLTPSDSPDFESVQAGPEPDPPVGYTSPFLSARIAQQRETDLHGRFAGAVSPKHAPPREPSPVRYDNLSRHIVASMQEREKLLQQPPAPGREEDAGLADSGIQSTPGSSNAPRTSSSSDDSKRSPLGKNPLTRPAPPRFGKPEPPHALRVRSLGSPDQPAAPHLGKSVSYSSQKPASQAGVPETEEVALQPLLAPK